MNYIGSVNKKTLEVKWVVVKGIDWVSIPEGTTDITVHQSDDVWFWNTEDNMTVDNGFWRPCCDETCLNTFDVYCEIQKNNIAVINLDSLKKNETESTNLDDKTVKIKSSNYSEMFNPLDVQAGGGHYKKRGIQPVEYGLANNLSFPQVNVTKYITRHEDKNGIEDLSKSIHYHFIEALRCYGVEGSTKLKSLVLEMLGEEK